MDGEYVVYICSGILFSHRRNGVFPVAMAWMDLESVMLSERRQRKTDTIGFHLYVESKKKLKEIQKTTEIDS